MEGKGKCEGIRTTAWYILRLSQVGVVSYGSECPSHGVYARVTEVKHWIQYIAAGSLDTNCNEQIPYQPGISHI